MKKLILLLSVFILIFVSCSNNVYIDDAIDNPEKEIKKIWRVGTTYFETANDAISYIMEQPQSRSVTRDVDESRTIVLTRHVLASDNELGDDYKEYIEDDDLRGSINVPSDFTGDLVIDFNEKRYDFSNECKAFFVIEGGSSVKIYNGTSVIYDKASHEPYAISVDTKTVTIDEHLIDDRRKDNKLIYISEDGHLSIKNVDGLSGEIALLTDGKTGGELDITSSDITIDNIYTKYKDANGNVSDKIDGAITIDKNARSVINICSGTVTIKAINQGTDYYDVSTDTPFERAVLNTCGTKDNTTIRSAHEIHDIVERAIKESGDNAKHEIWHDLEHHARVEATCTASGNIEYWRCKLCGKYFSDEGKTEIAESAVTIAIDPDAHSLEHIEAKAATCTENGNIEYWYCTRCGKYFEDEEVTKEITKDKTVILHHIVLEEWEYDIDNHWHVCTVDGYRVGTDAHNWGDWEEKTSGSVTHLYKECSVCGARKVATKPEYLVYNIGIGELKLKDIEATPCGDFYINNKKVESESTIKVDSADVTAEFRPYLGSNTDFKAYCLVNNKEITTGGKNNDNIYKVYVTLSGSGEHVLNIQTITGGGSLGFVCYIKVKK